MLPGLWNTWIVSGQDAVLYTEGTCLEIIQGGKGFACTAVNGAQMIHCAYASDIGCGIIQGIQIQLTDIFVEITGYIIVYMGIGHIGVHGTVSAV